MVPAAETVRKALKRSGVPTALVMASRGTLSGGSGIRTHGDGLRHDGFQDRILRPLGHPSRARHQTSRTMHDAAQPSFAVAYRRSVAPPTGRDQNGPMTEKQYVGDGITVLWHSDRCIHSAHCATTLPRVFRPQERP